MGMDADSGCMVRFLISFFFQAEDGIRDLVRSRGLGDVYKRQAKKRKINYGHARRSAVSAWEQYGEERVRK